MQTAVVLAAGSGSRLWPYGSTWAKAALPLANRPLLRRLLDHLSAVGIDRVVVVAGDLAGQVRQAAAGHPGVTVLAAPPGGGTAGALAAALPHVSDDDWLVVYGDTLPAPADLQALIDLHRAAGEPATVLAAPLDAGEHPQDWICVKVSGDRVTDLTGHPRHPYQHRLAGAFALNRRFGEYLERNPGFLHHVPTGGMPPMEPDLAGSLALLLDEAGEMPGVIAREPSPDVDKPWHLLQWNRWQAIRDCGGLSDSVIHPTARIHDGAEIAGRVMLGEGAVIGPGVVVKGNLIVGAGTTITRGALIGANCVIGEHSLVTDYARLEDATVLGSGVRVGHCAEVDGVLLDRTAALHHGEFAGLCGRNVDLGAGTLCGTLRFDDGATAHKVRGRTEWPLRFSNCAYLGDFTRTGVGAILLPGVKVGPYSAIGPGVIVTEDVPERTLLLAEQTLVRREWGPSRHGW